MYEGAVASASHRVMSTRGNSEDPTPPSSPLPRTIYLTPPTSPAGRRRPIPAQRAASQVDSTRLVPCNRMQKADSLCGCKDSEPLGGLSKRSSRWHWTRWANCNGKRRSRRLWPDWIGFAAWQRAKGCPLEPVRCIDQSRLRRREGEPVGDGYEPVR